MSATPRQRVQSAQAFLATAKILKKDEAWAHAEAERMFDYRELDYHYPLRFRVRRRVRRAAVPFIPLVGQLAASTRRAVSTLTGRSKA